MSCMFVAFVSATLNLDLKTYLYINRLYSGVSDKKQISKDLLPETYEQYKTNFYWEQKKCNEKTADIQTFNCIADLLAQNESLKKRNIEQEIQNLQTTRNWFNDD